MALIILAHPNFAQSIANRAVIDALTASGLDLEIRDLAALYPDYRIAVAAEQAALLRHQSIVFQYPLYWYSPPAILKQYFDSVLTLGFAYGRGGDALRGKDFLPSITIGAPAEDYRADGAAHFRVVELCKPLEQTAYYCQMRYHDPFHCHGTSPALYDAATIRVRAEASAAGLVARLKALAAPLAD